MRIREFFLFFPFGILLSGCQLDMHRSAEDYTGSDAAKIRVLDKGKLSLGYFEKGEDCYKGTETRKLTSAFHLSLLSSADYSTGFAKKVNMQTPSSFGTSKVKEYTIKAGQPYMVSNANSVADYFGNNIVYESSLFFYPEEGHEYEIYAKPPEYIKSAGVVVINDLTTNKSAKRWNNKTCSVVE